MTILKSILQILKRDFCVLQTLLRDSTDSFFYCWCLFVCWLLKTFCQSIQNPVAIVFITLKIIAWTRCLFFLDVLWLWNPELLSTFLRILSLRWLQLTWPLSFIFLLRRGLLCLLVFWLARFVESSWSTRQFFSFWLGRHWTLTTTLFR